MNDQSTASKGFASRETGQTAGTAVTGTGNGQLVGLLFGIGIVSFGSIVLQKVGPADIEQNRDGGGSSRGRYRLFAHQDTVVDKGG